MTTMQNSGGGAYPRTIVRWLWIWITLGIIVVVVVIGFLIGIVRALNAINDGLAEADTAVAGAGGDVEPLPAHIEGINGNLAEIDKSLLPINGQADRISTNLGTITGSLQKIDDSLKNTSGSLVDTSGSLVNTSTVLVTAGDAVHAISGSLVDTSNVLVNILDTADEIEVTLESAQQADKLGTAAVINRVGVINGLLGPINDDTSDINKQLQLTNKHLDDICNSPLLTLPVFRPQVCD